MIRKTTFFLVALMFSAFSLLAQTEPPKYGHMNLGNLLEQMPETAKAEADLRVMADSLNRKDSVMTAEFQAAFLKLKQEYDAGDLTAVQIQQRQTTLETQRQAIQKFEENAQAQLEVRRNDLLGPILERVEAAIQAVAKENGFLMIFDVSTGSSFALSPPGPYGLVHTRNISCYNDFLQNA